MSPASTRARWARELQRRVERHFTGERTRSLFGDKRLLLPPTEAAPLLRVLGLLNGDGSMSPRAVRKYLQVNHMVALLEPLLLDLARRFEVVRMLEAGCGRSHVGLLIAWCFEHRYHHPIRVLGVDANPDVVATCRDRTPLAGLADVLRFEHARIGALDVKAAWQRAFGSTPPAPTVHGLVALHACDTATDEALGLGVALGADLLAAAPCCHAELARKWARIERRPPPDPWGPIRRSPHLRREAGASVTDAMRTLLLRGAGYEVTAMEFVPSEHTPKNTLLRATRCGGPRTEALAEYVELRRQLGGAGIRLEELLPAARQAVADPAPH